MKTYIKTKWNRFRLLALGSILVCANGSQANAATDPNITWPTLAPIDYTTPLTSTTHLNALAKDPTTTQLIAGDYVYRVASIGVVTNGYYTLPVNTTGWTLSVEFTPANLSAYNHKTNSQVLVVNPKTLNMVVYDASRLFGEANPEFKFSWVNGEPLGEDKIVGYASAGPSVTVTSPAGGDGYTISGGINDPLGRGTNYTINITTAKLYINKAPLYITPIKINTSYGVSNAYTRTDAGAFTVASSGTLVYTNDLTNVVAKISLYSTSDPSNPYTGNNKITTSWPQANDQSTPSYYYLVDSVKAISTTAGAAAGAAFDLSGNYTVVSNFNNFTVSRVALTLSATNQTWPYGGMQQFTGSISGVVKTAEFDDITNLVFTWSSYSANAAPGSYTVTPNVTEKDTAQGRLNRNYYPITYNSGSLVITKRVPEINWVISDANKYITYGTLIGANQKNAAYKNLLDAATFQQPGALTYSIPTEPLNQGTAELVVIAPGDSYYQETHFTNTVTVYPYTPTINFVGITNAYGVPISSAFLSSATAVGSSTANATKPGGFEYSYAFGSVRSNLLEGKILLPKDGDYDVFAISAATQNYLSAEKGVKLRVTNGVFDIASPVVGTLRATVANAGVDFNFSGIAKVGDIANSNPDSKLTINGEQYNTDATGTTLSMVYAELVNTNSDASWTGNVHVALGPVSFGQNGVFVLSSTITPSELYPREILHPNETFVLGTNFELRVWYPTSWITNDVDGVPYQAVLGRTNVYVVTVGKLSTEVTLNTDNSDKSYVYGGTDNITFPVKVNFTSGDINLIGKTVKVAFNGTNYNVALTNSPSTGVYVGTFNLDISTPAGKQAYNAYSPAKTATATFDGDDATYNGSTKSINVAFTRRDVTFKPFATTGSVVYGENADTGTYTYKNYARAVAVTPTTTTGLTTWDSAVFAVNNLPSIYTPATQPGAAGVTVTVGNVDWSAASSGLSSLNYNVIKQEGTLFIMRRQLGIVINDVAVQTNEAHASYLASAWSITNWVDSGDPKTYLKAVGSGKIELTTDRVLTSAVNTSYYITNKLREVVGALPATPDTAHYASVHLLTNYLEYPNNYDTYNNALFGAQQYSFYIDGAIGSNYFIKAPVTYGKLSVVGIKPTAVWNPVKLTYGDKFSTGNVFNAVVSTNGTPDTNPSHYKYYAFRNDIDNGDYVQIFSDSGAYRVPMATNALKIRLVYDAAQPDLLATLTVDTTVAVDKAGLFVIFDDTTVAIQDAVTVGWKLHVTYNGIRNSDPLYGATRAIFARTPDTNSASIANFISCVITTNTGSYLTPLGNYRISQLVTDTGFNDPSNYSPVYVTGNYKVAGATITAGPTWDGTTNNTTNIKRTYGWYYSKTELLGIISSATAFVPAINNAASQVTITINGAEVADGTLLSASTNQIVFKYQYDSTYEPKLVTNVIQIAKYTIHAVVKWDATIGGKYQRAYRDNINLFPTLWDSTGTNFALLTPITTAGPFNHIVTFDANEAKSVITNGLGVTVQTLTNGPGLATNLMFAVTNELLSDLGLQVYNKSVDDSAIGAYEVGLKATSASGQANYDIVVYNGTSSYPVAQYIAVTNALLRVRTGNASRAYGALNPAFSGVIYAVKSDATTEYANLDGIYLTFSCLATNVSPVGTYAINSQLVDPNAKVGNYSIDNANSQQVGVLTVTGAVLTAVANNLDLRTSQTRPAVSNYTTKSITGYVNDETASVITTQPQWDSAFVSGATVGTTYPITNKVAGVAANYTFAYVNGLATVKTNTPPTPRSDTVTVPAGTATGKIDVSKLINNDYSPFGDKLTLVSFSATSTNGIAMGTDNTKFWLYYNTSAKTLTPGARDRFTYTVKDSVGGTGTGSVEVKVLSTTTNTVPNNIIKAERNETTGAMTLTFLGINGRNSYHVQGASDLNGPWSDLSLYDRNVFPNLTGATLTNIFTCVNGAIIVTDPDAASYGNRFYRAITPQ
jgi:hypothetical protein